MNGSDDPAGVFVDATSLDTLKDVIDRRVESLGQLLESRVDGLWQSLEMLVLYEKLHVDGFVLAEWDTARAVAEALSDVVEFHTDFSLSFRAADYAIRLVDQMPRLRQLAGREGLPSWFLGEHLAELFSFKEMSEKIVWAQGVAGLGELEALEESRLSRYSISSVMSSSIHDAERAIYYYFLARQLGLPYLPNSYRSAVYRALLYSEKPLRRTPQDSESGEQSTIEMDIVRFIEKTARVPRWEARSEILPSELWSVDISPLSALIFRESARTRTTLVEAALAVRERPETKHFRKFCSSLRKAIQEGRNEKVDRDLEELSRVAADWAKMSDASPFRRRRLTIGSILKTDVEILDPKIKVPFLLSRRKHLVFLHELAMA